MKQNTSHLLGNQGAVAFVSWIR